jgi:calcineurin-like phosphoesterase family protein
MSAFFVGDPHLGHKNIAKFRPWVQSTEENTAIFCDFWQNTIRKNDIVFVMGDAAFCDESLDVYKNLRGRKILIKGNHCDYVSTRKQIEAFDEIHGMLSYKKMWLTHCPIHPHEMRGRVANVHGHVHAKSIQKRTWYGAWKDDPQYINTCVDHVYEKTGGRSIFTSLEEVRARLNIK